MAKPSQAQAEIISLWVNCSSSVVWHGYFLIGKSNTHSSNFCWNSSGAGTIPFVSTVRSRKCGNTRLFVELDVPEPILYITYGGYLGLVRESTSSIVCIWYVLLSNALCLFSGFGSMHPRSFPFFFWAATKPDTPSEGSVIFSMTPRDSKRWISSSGLSWTASGTFHSGILTGTISGFTSKRSVPAKHPNPCSMARLHLINTSTQASRKYCAQHIFPVSFNALQLCMLITFLFSMTRLNVLSAIVALSSHIPLPNYSHLSVLFHLSQMARQGIEEPKTNDRIYGCTVLPVEKKRDHVILQMFNAIVQAITEHSV